MSLTVPPGKSRDQLTSSDTVALSPKFPNGTVSGVTEPSLAARKGRLFGKHLLLVTGDVKGDPIQT